MSLPDSSELSDLLQSLKSRGDTAQELTQYYEMVFQNARSKDYNEAIALDGEAKNMIADTMKTIVQDIEGLAHALNKVTDRSLEEVDMVMSRVDLMQSKLRIMTEQESRMNIFDKLRNIHEEPERITQHAYTEHSKMTLTEEEIGINKKLSERYHAKDHLVYAVDEE